MDEPLDCGESGDILEAVEDDEAALLECVEVSGNHQTEDASSTTEPMKQSAKPDELAWSLDPLSVACSNVSLPIYRKYFIGADFW